MDIGRVGRARRGGGVRAITVSTPPSSPSSFVVPGLASGVEGGSHGGTTAPQPSPWDNALLARKSAAARSAGGRGGGRGLVGVEARDSPVGQALIERKELSQRLAHSGARG